MLARRTFVLGAAAMAAQGDNLERFAMFGKFVAKPGQRDALVTLLLEASADMPGCLVYTVHVSAAEPESIWVYEAWVTEADHDNSLKLEKVRDVITRARPLIAGFGDSVKLTGVGGKGF
jgi:quinol monooxygenase YgiN